jgi:predicted dehydrogenase
VLRGAFIGFGNVAQNGHLPGWQARDDIAIVAATDVLASRRDAFLKACPHSRWYESIDDLLASEMLDFVDICTPPGAHAELIDRALRSELHVLCEKPLVTEPNHARSVAASAASAGRVVYTVHNWLKAPVCLKVSALIDAGAVGRTRSIRWRTVRTGPAAAVGSERNANWRIDPELGGGGILFDHGWHALYCTTHWGGAPDGIAAVLENRRFHARPIEDTATVTLDLPGGSGHIYLTWAGDERCNSIEVEGEQGHISVAGDRIILSTSSAKHHWTCPPSLSEGSHHRDWFGGVAEDFHATVTSRGRGNLDEALLCAHLIDLARRSSLAGGVRLPVGP